MLKTQPLKLRVKVALLYLVLQLRLSGVDGFVEQHVARGPVRLVPAHLHGARGLLENLHVLACWQRH